MKKMITNIALLSLLMIVLIGQSSCRMSQVAINSGDYQDAVERSVHKLRNNKKKNKAILELEQAYTKANQQDLARINRLYNEGLNENDLAIYELYRDLDARQDLVTPLLPLYIKKEDRNARIKTDNYNNQLAEFRKKAADYLYDESVSLLASNGKFAAREAHRLLRKLDNFYPNYRNVRNLLGQASDMGTNKILFELENHTGLPLPPNFNRELHKISVTELDGMWSDFDTEEKAGVDYDYVIVMNLEEINMSPDVLTQDIYTREKEVEDGWKYVLDAKGNVLKDTLGNDVKVPVYKMVFAHVKETIQHKETTLIGSIDFRTVDNGELLGSFPLATTAAFDNRFATIQGDRRALESQDTRLLNGGVQAFPSDADMLMNGIRQMKPLVLDAIYDNKMLVLN